MDSKKINIVTINLNNKDGLEKTIKSVVEQTYFDKTNYIVIDGGSTDGSVDVIKQYDDKITHWVSERDNGVYNAMNKGVDLCNGEYVLFLNSGDYFHDNKVIEDVYEELDTDIVYGGLNVHTGKRQYILNDDYYLNKGLPHPSTFTKTKLLRENKFNEDYKIISDWIFFYETIYLKRTGYKRLNRVISDFFLGGISSNAKNCNQEKEKYFKSLEKDESHVKIAMCSIGRLENKYAVEFVDFYEKMGVDKFYIYDNNYGDEEHFEEVLKPYIDNGLVEIINYRDKSYCQVQSYQDCYDKHGKEFDWICFFDFDEYILLAENLKTLKQLLSLDIYKEYDVLHINELIYGDSEKLRYENIPLTQRFTKPVQPIDYKRTFNFPENCHVKTIVRGGLENVLWNGTPHTPTNNLKCCNAAGEPCQSNSPFVIPYCYKNVCLRHYKTKTLEEYYEIKVKRGYPDGNKDLFKKKSWIDEFFKENVKTKEKLDFINELLERGSDKYGCKVGVVIPCYNSEKYIEETINSLKKQTFTDWKCVIVNDGSTDKSEEIILKCIDGDKRFSYIKQENHGLPYTRNVGIRNLNSKYIFCLDSDDIINEKYFELGVEFLDNNPDYSIFYGKAKFLYEGNVTKDWNLPEYGYAKLLYGNMIYCSFLYRRYDYEKTNGYDESMKGFEDWEFLIRLLQVSGKVYRSDDVLFYYRRHKNSMDRIYNRGDNRIKMLKFIYNKNREIYEKHGISINDLLKRYTKKDVCILIFTHKEKLESYEELSFIKCLKVFGTKRDIKLVAPDNISTEYYGKYSNLFEIVKVNTSWMDSNKSYNQMLCNSEFWKMFNDYEYVLTYQTDCWAYEDKLDYFIGLGYDYYGAPWPIYDNKVGNGGLSLRKVSKMIEITEKYEFIRGSINEDGWFCLKHADEINICPVEIAANFSLEIPSISILKMVKDVPMGLHGKYLMNLWDENGDNFRKYNRLKMVQMKKLALIIPTKDNSESLLRLLYSIVYRTEYDKAKLAIHVVDNGSKEDEKNKVIKHLNRVIKEYGYDIRYHETDNYTLPQLYNFVANEKIDNDTDLLLFCTDNVELTNDAITKLVDNWSEQCGTLGARLMFEDDTIQHIGYNIKKDNFTCYDVVQKQILPAEYRDKRINVYGNSNSFMLTSFGLWKQLNGFDEKYKSNFFDIDYSIKALLNGKNSYNITGAVCWYHKAIKSKYVKRDENRISKRIKEYLTIIDETAEKRREDKAKNA